MSLAPPQTFRKAEGLHRTGLAASRPAAADVLIGTLYFSTDTGALERSTGSAWSPYVSSASGPPAAHHTTHEAGGTDTIAVAESLLSLSDVTTGNVTTGRHGFAPKLPNDATRFFDGVGAYNALSWVDVTFNAANFAAGNGTMVWAVTAGNVNAFGYVRIGKTVLLSLALTGTSLTGTSDTSILNITIPVVAARTVIAPVYTQDGSGAAGTAVAQLNAGGSTIQCFRNFLAPAYGAGALHLLLQFIIPV